MLAKPRRLGNNQTTFISLDDNGLEEESEAFHSPPFNPAGSNANDYEDDIAEDEDEEETFHILPIGDVDEAFNSGSNQESTGFETDSPSGTLDDQDPHREVLTDEYVDEDAAESEVTEGHTTESVDEINEGEMDEGLTASEEFTPATGPTSYETDPNPESSTYCSEPYSPDSPLIQYALVIDAGSTGSRIHVYKFNNCGPSAALEYETFKAVQPGLSSFARDPTAAAASLDALMEEAVRVVPESLHHCSPIEVKATAGLRLLPGNEGQAILEEVRVRLESDWPFALGKDENAIEIMDGKDEGKFG
jgi:guanosine-diphosphatase